MIYHWIRENGNGAYFVGRLPDGAYDELTCIFVPPKPTPAHKWNNEIKEWVIGIEDQREMIRSIRNTELKRTDKFMLSDFFDKFSEEEQLVIKNYRQTLRDVPNHENIEDIVMPECPEILLETI